MKEVWPCRDGQGEPRGIAWQFGCGLQFAPLFALLCSTGAAWDTWERETETTGGRKHKNYTAQVSEFFPRRVNITSCL